MNLERYGNTSAGSIPLCLEEAWSDGRLKKGDRVLMIGFGGGLDVGLVPDRVGGRRNGRAERRMGEGGVLFPGPGLAGGRHGRARSPKPRRPPARPSTAPRHALGFDVAEVCFDGPLERLSSTEMTQPALTATSLACLAAVREAGFARRLRDRPLGRRVRGAGRGRALSADDAMVLVRERGLATAEAARETPGAMAAVIGLADEQVERALRRHRRRLAGQLQLPRPAGRVGHRGGRGGA